MLTAINQLSDTTAAGAACCPSLPAEALFSAKSEQAAGSQYSRNSRNNCFKRVLKATGNFWSWIMPKIRQNRVVLREDPGVHILPPPPQHALSEGKNCHTPSRVASTCYYSRGTCRQEWFSGLLNTLPLWVSCSPLPVICRKAFRWQIPSKWLPIFVSQY